MSFFKHTLYSIILILGSICITPANSSPIVIKFSHVVTPDTPKGKGVEYFKKLVEERTMGNVKVQVYPNSQLYKDKEELEALQLGAVEMLAPSLSKFSPMGFTAFELFDLPYLFSNYNDLHKVTNGKIGQQLLTSLSTKGIKGLAYWDNGFKVMSANKSLVELKDFRGKKMRIQSSRILDAQMRALGVSPQVIAFSEVYQGLQTGVVDGTEQTPSQIYTQKFFEVQKFITLTNHGYLGYAVVVNKKFWDGLTPQIQSVLETAMKESTDYVNKIAEQDNQESLAKIKASGRTQLLTLTSENQSSLKVTLTSIYPEQEKRIGKDVIDAVRKELAIK
ncbi:TRAP transporter substrate-binding protein [Undibacterium crateris]|uniref:TRAP transporter substrate-binding protein n=1 Tax=Undibacterium crateris TaxID=2528175 RepID=UPI00138A0053|nr:TRAP transporter substrate-binding protein [Undibacterium crateris]NDI87629.1 DctP family TRAP transporter solute-binding subunit [Undibacterium crateris]